jgi:small subunit ribosomal protein S1
MTDMASLSRRYRSAPPPPPPDEYYWAALLTQEEEAVDERASAEEIVPSNSETYQPHLVDSYGTFTGNPEDWQTALRHHENDETVTLRVTGFNKGGLLVDWNSLRGFVPTSQLVEDLHDYGRNLTEAMESYIGCDLSLRVIEIEPDQNRLILSERAAQVSPGTRASIFKILVPGITTVGTVTNVCDFGVFVDLGGVEGLIHISELSWGRVEHPSQILKRDQRISVYIMEVSPDEGRVALSLKRLKPDPWKEVASHYHVGEEVEAVISSIVDFGAFAALEEGLEGLIHVSEMAEGHFLHPRNVVREGQKVRVRILNIDKRARRIGLSLRSPQNNTDA